MNDFAAHWNNILQGDEKNQVDLVASLHEDGLNHFLLRHFEIDGMLPAKDKKYSQTFERTFQTFGDERKFKITLALTQPIILKLPPFSDEVHLSASFKETSGWQSFNYPTEGPELLATNQAAENLVEVIAPGVSVSMEWPRLDGTQPPWNFVIPPFEVLAQAELQLNQEEPDFFVTIIPKLVHIDIPRNNSLSTIVQDEMKNAPAELQLLVADAEEKFVDLFIIAANIAAYEQTPKLVTSIKLPIPVIKERPIQPAAFDISNNILTVGFGIDKVVLESFNMNVLKTKNQELEYAINKDIEEANGLLNVSFRNAEGKKLLTPHQLIPRSDEESKVLFNHTNAFIQKQKAILNSFESSAAAQSSTEALAVVDEAFAIGINEYFFDVIVNSALPQPKHRCENEAVLGPVKGYICHWTAFTNPDVSISSDAVLAGAVDINVGGSIHACVKKFWDCSWRWACAKLALAIVGRPRIELKVLSADGIRVLAQLSGDVKLASNLPFPFNKIIEALSAVVIQILIAFINVLAVLLSFYVLKPDIKVEDLHVSLNLQNFSSFYFQRTQSPSQDITKNKFICFKTNISVSSI